MAAHDGAVEEARRSTRQILGGPLRELHDDHARPRPHHRCRDRRDKRWHDHRRSRSKPGRIIGAYFSTIAAGIPTTLYGRMIAGCYKIPHIRVDVIAAYTNTAMVDAYRGAGRPEAAYVIERVCDLVADATGVDPTEVRRKNFIQPEDFPYDTGIGMLPYDSGNYEITLDKALEMLDYNEFRAEQKRRRAAGERKMLGIGLSSYVEVCGVAPSQMDRSARRGLGRRSLGKRQCQSASHRQSGGHHRFTPSRAGARNDVCPDRCRPVSAFRTTISRSNIPIRGAHRLASARYGSRSAVSRWHRDLSRASTRSSTKRKRLAAHMLEAAEQDLTYENGKVFGQGHRQTRPRPFRKSRSPRTSGTICPKGWNRSSTRPRTTTRRIAPSRLARMSAWSRSTRTRGVLDRLRYLAVDDVGNVINPLIVDGQLHGGIAQGLAQALYEGAVYDDDGQLLTRYAVRLCHSESHQVPWYELDRTVTPSPGQSAGRQGRRRGRYDCFDPGRRKCRHRCGGASGQ